MNILMVGHSYVVTLNRSLCRAVALAGGPEVQVTVAAPLFMHAELRPIRLEPLDGEPYRLVGLSARATRYPHFLHYGRDLGRLMRSSRWDLVHAWAEPYLAEGFQIAKACPDNARLVFSTFQNIAKRYPPPFDRMERDCLRHADGWMAGGHTIEATLARRSGYRDLPMRRIPLGVDLDAFWPDPAARAETRRRLGWDDDAQSAPVVGFLGRFVPEKGLRVLTRALDALPAGTWRALMVGGGPLEGELRAWSERHPGRVQVRTGVAHDEVPAHLNAMDVLAAPSQTTPRWREQLGRMLLEAMACGVPVVASDSGEVPYVIEDAGMCLPEADVAAWTSALEHLLNDPDARRELAARGLARVRDHFAWPLIARNTLDFYREVAANGQARSSFRSQP